MSRPVAGAVFDIVVLLLHTERLSRDAYRSTRDWAGLPPDDGLFLSLVGLNSRDGDARLGAPVVATREELLEVIQLTTIMGIHTVNMAVPILADISRWVWDHVGAPAREA